MASSNVHSFGATESDEATVKTGCISGEHQITAFAVLDAEITAGNFPPTLHSTAAGTLTLWCKVWGADEWEEVYQSDGVTQVTFDPTAAKTNAVKLTGSYTDFKVEPASLDSDCVAYIAVSSDNRG